MNLFLLSNSTMAGEPYLQFCKDEINTFLAQHQAKNVLFIPFAAVGFSYDEYTKKVTEGLQNTDLNIVGIHQFEDKPKAVREADAIIVGGGNTFHLLSEMYQHNVLLPIKERVSEGLPYIGWSAGSNLSSPTIKTTNDMPIIEPPAFNALGLIPFQINPHYIHGNPPGHNGETREQRLTEFLAANQNMKVVGLREGTAIKVAGSKIDLWGEREARIFAFGKDPYELQPGADLSFLLEHAL